jgi:hypothetical protein
MGGIVFAYVPADVGQLKKLAATLAPAECADHRAWIAIEQVQTIVARIDIRLQHTLPSGEVFFRVLTFAVAREVKQCRRWRAAVKWSIVAHIPRRMSVTPPAIQTFTPSGNAIMPAPAKDEPPRPYQTSLGSRRDSAAQLRPLNQGTHRRASPDPERLPASLVSPQLEKIPCGLQAAPPCTEPANPKAERSKFQADAPIAPAHYIPQNSPAIFSFSLSDR